MQRSRGDPTSGNTGGHTAARTQPDRRAAHRLTLAAQQAGLRAFVRDAKGESCLTPWEHYFVIHMEQLAVLPGAGLLSSKQSIIIEQIRSKVAQAEITLLAASEATAASSLPDPDGESSDELANIYNEFGIPWQVSLTEQPGWDASVVQSAPDAVRGSTDPLVKRAVHGQQQRDHPA